MKKNEIYVALLMLLFLVVALAAMALTKFKGFDEKIALVAVSCCITGVLITFYIWKSKMLGIDELKIYELYSRGKVKNNTTRKVIQFVTLALMAVVFYIIFKSEINNYYVFVFVILHILVNSYFIAPKKLVINTTGIHCFPNWKIKWEEFKEYSLDKNNGILLLVKESEQRIKVNGINNEDFTEIEKMISKHNKN